MVGLVQPQQLQYGMSPQLAAAMEQSASAAGTVPQALGLALAKPLAGFNQAYERQQKTERDSQLKALALQAAQGDPVAQEQLLATDPAMGLQLQQAEASQQEMQLAQAQSARAEQDFEEKELQRQRNEIGRYGNLISAAVGPKRREVVQQFYDRIEQEGGDPSMFGLDSREQIDTLSTEQLKKVAESAQSMAIAPLELRKLEQPRGPLVNVEMGGEKAERTAMGKIQAKRFETIIAEGEAAQSVLDATEQLSAFQGVTTGTLEPFKANLAGVLKGIGMPESLTNEIANVGNAQAMRAVSNRAVNAVLNQAKGPQTEGDAKRALSTIANLGDDPRAFRFKNASLKSVALRQIERAQFIDSRIDEGKTFSAANKEWNAFKRDTPNLSDVVKGGDGLPMFYFEFKEHARARRPDIPEEQILQAWRAAH